MRLDSYGKQSIDEEDISAVVDALKAEMLTTGPLVKQFEDSFCQYIGCKHAVAVCNGTAALDISVEALQLPEGSEIIVTPFTFMADINAILYNNHKPVLCDINPQTLNIDEEKIEPLITPKTKAILFVDFGGRPCNIERLKEIAERHKLFLIEDACHAVGGEYKGRKIGSIVDMTVFSFHPVKTMTTGEGGMVTTDNTDWARRMRIHRHHGIVKPPQHHRYGDDAFYEYDAVMLGRNYRITDFQCALGISQLKKVDKFANKRLKLVRLYNSMLADVQGVSTPLNTLPQGERHSIHLYYVLLDRGIPKNSFMKLMKAKGIGVHSFYIPVYNFSYHQKILGLKREDFPVAEDTFSRIVILPLFPQMSQEDVGDVVKAVRQSMGELK